MIEGECLSCYLMKTIMTILLLILITHCQMYSQYPYNKVFIHEKKVEQDGGESVLQGVENNLGEIIVSPKYESVFAFNHNLFKVYLGGKYGLVDQKRLHCLPNRF